MKYISTSLIDILRWRAENQPNNLSYRFLKDGEYDEVSITYKELDQRARSIGAMLQASTKAGDRALLLFPAGLDFITAYFGCLYAKVIAIPAYPPHPARLEKSLLITLRIAADAKPSIALMASSLYDAIVSRNEFKAEFGNMKLLATDTGEWEDWSEKWQQPGIEKNDIAFLQYSSGSTSSPKGVMVTHNNLLHNLDIIEKSMGLTDKSQTVFWLPPYHDMGLIGGILQPIYTGFPVTLMSHLMFLQRPIRWLQAISRFHATTSGAPNFAYDLCVRKVKPDQRKQLDLSAWEVAFNGAEPVSQRTLDKFTDYFALCGFRREAFSPCYGLAEATLMVVGAAKGRTPIMHNIMKSGLKKNRVIFSSEMTEDTQILVSCGKNPEGQKIRIVNSGTLSRCLPDEIGEIWVSSPSVTSGYWNNPLATASVFGAYLSDCEEGPFLRTGDLGFFDEGELYITGRLKNIIIIDGKNFYPHDIEKTVEQAHPSILPGGCAVFSIQNPENEGVVVVAEIQHRFFVNPSEVVKAIRASVTEHHDLSIFDIKLTPTGRIPRTTSGKIRHFLCKENYLAGTLNEMTLV